MLLQCRETVGLCQCRAEGWEALAQPAVVFQLSPCSSAWSLSPLTYWLQCTALLLGILVFPSSVLDSQP